MDTYYRNVSRRKTKVTILATHSLVRQSIQLLLDNDRDLSVVDTAATAPELMEKISRHNPDVVLLCLMENEGRNIEILSELRRINSHIKAVILSSPQSSLNHPEALKLGVTGIVGTSQSERVLIRAIRQVAEGEVWLNQKLLEQLLDNKFNTAANNPQKKKGSYNDDLTVRELEVVSMIGLGMNNKVISQKLFISEATVRHHLSSIYGKLNVEDRLNLAIYAYRHQMISPVGAN